MNSSEKTVLIDINHPAHVHFFKNLYFELKNIGLNVVVTASLKDINYELLRELDIDFIDLGSYGRTPFFKMMNVPLMAIKMAGVACKYKPDYLLGISSSRICHATVFSKSKTYVFDDTENAPEQIALFKPFATKIFTPDCYIKNLGKKQIRYPGYHVLAYLHPNRFSPNPGILQELGLSTNDTFFILRFVSWQATHDFRQKGLSMIHKRKLVETLSDYGKVFISSENKLPDDLESYRLKICPTKMHDLLYYATLVYGESATMASECAVLGTHAFFIDYAGRGYTNEQEKKYELVFNYQNNEPSIQQSFKKLAELVQRKDLKQMGEKKRMELLRDKIDVTTYMLNLLL